MCCSGSNGGTRMTRCGLLCGLAALAALSTALLGPAWLHTEERLPYLARPVANVVTVKFKLGLFRVCPKIIKPANLTAHSKRKERLEKIALKKKRSAFIARQLSGLDEELSTLPYLKKSERLRLAKELDIPERSLKIWYQNQRAKWSKNSRDSQNRDGIGSEILTSEQNSLSIVEQNVLTADISDSVIESSEGAIINGFANTDYPNAHPGFVEKQRFQEILNSIGRSVDNSVHEVPQFNKDYDAFQGPPQKRYRYTDILNPTPDLQSDGSFLQNRPGINHRRSQKS